MVPNEFFDALDAYEIHRASLRPPCPAALKQELYRRQDGQCNNPPCDEHQPIHDLVCDYVVPLHASGADHPDNIQLLCRTCKTLKGSGTMEDLAARREARRDGIPAKRRARRVMAFLLPPVVMVGLVSLGLVVAIIVVGMRCG